ncbi:hypothetical protein Nepgr_007151 [Nepenthes gracilis]|uniref:Uncharacterized protein n=1 Tax=Nepenthes gracilis TaxID=150966 RepID=A0AAD3XI94_NEPGR|nr:hypothetical protein Nepgr_007151 [Nepenthes gracilis]
MLKKAISLGLRLTKCARPMALNPTGPSLRLGVPFWKRVGMGEWPPTPKPPGPPNQSCFIAPDLPTCATAALQSTIRPSLLKAIAN